MFIYSWNCGSTPCKLSVEPISFFLKVFMDFRGILEFLSRVVSLRSRYRNGYSACVCNVIEMYTWKYYKFIKSVSFLTYLGLAGWLSTQVCLTVVKIFMAGLSQGFVFHVQPPRFVNLRKKQSFSLEFRNFILFEPHFCNFLFVIFLLFLAFWKVSLFFSVFFDYLMYFKHRKGCFIIQ